jgi:hypothetical protein
MDRWTGSRNRREQLAGLSLSYFVLICGVGTYINTFRFPITSPYVQIHFRSVWAYALSLNTQKSKVSGTTKLTFAKFLPTILGEEIQMEPAEARVADLL